MPPAPTRADPPDRAHHATTPRTRRSSRPGLALTLIAVAVLVVGGLVTIRLAGPGAGYLDVWERPTGGSLLLAELSAATDVTAGGPGFVAVGHVVDDGPPVVWASPDGRGWTRVTDADGALGPDDAGARMTAVTAGPGGLVAVGTALVDGVQHAAVWGSADGTRWVRRWHDPEGAGSAMAAVAAAGPGFVAVGHHGDDGAIWTSTDGGDWRRLDVEVLRSLPPPDGTAAVLRLHGVTAGGPGVVAVGAHSQALASGPPRSHAVVLSSPDGVAWERIGHDEAVLGGPEPYRMLAVAAGGPGLVAVGDEVGVGGAVWTSPDGRTWQRTHGSSGPLRGRSLVAITTLGDGPLVAVGIERRRHEGVRRDRATVLTSADGSRWQQERHASLAYGRHAEVQLAGAAAAGSTVVVVGHRDDARTFDRDPVALVGTLR